MSDGAAVGGFDRHAGRRVLVTGGARGIGLGIARRFLHEGASVVLVDVHADALSDALRQLAVPARRAMTVTCDISSEEEVHAMVARVVEQLGGIDILVNNAGISPKHAGIKSPVALMALAEWKQVLDVNLTGAFLCARACVPGMAQRHWGRIVNIGSLAGRSRSELSGAHYGASKAGMASLARTLAFEVGELGITVNSVAPGRIDTPMAATVSQEVNDRYRATIPVRRFGTPDDVAAAVSYLAGDDAGFVTGVTLDVNGGALMI